MATIKERIWDGNKYVEIDAGTVDGRDSLEFETADPAIQNHIKTPHASVATVNSNRADLDVIKNSGYLKGVDSVAFENFDPINAQFLGGNTPEYYVSQSALTSGLNTKVDKTSIVNNLTTGGETSVLSAEQGKILNIAVSQKSDLSDFIATSQSLVVGSGFEAQTGASPFNVTKSGQMLYFIGQLKCLTNTSAFPVVLATSSISPVTYFNLNMYVNDVPVPGLVVEPVTGAIYAYKTFLTNDIIRFDGFAIGEI